MQPSTVTPWSLWITLEASSMWTGLRITPTKIAKTTMNRIAIQTTAYRHWSGIAITRAIAPLITLARSSKQTHLIWRWQYEDAVRTCLIRHDRRHRTDEGPLSKNGWSDRDGKADGMCTARYRPLSRQPNRPFMGWRCVPNPRPATRITRHIRLGSGTKVGFIAAVCKPCLRRR